MRTRDEAKENAIRRKAMELIVNEGFDGLSMHKVAKAAKVSVATIYIYFKDREDLILNLCKQELSRMADATLQNFSPDMSFPKGLKIQWKNRAGYWMKNPVEAQFLERMRHSPYHDMVIKFQKKDFLAAMYSFVENAIRNGELVNVPLEIFWSVAYAPLYQLVKFHMDEVRFPGQAPVKLTDRKMDTALQLVLKALKPQPYPHQ